VRIAHWLFRLLRVTFVKLSSTQAAWRMTILIIRFVSCTKSVPYANGTCIHSSLGWTIRSIGPQLPEVCSCHRLFVLLRRTCLVFRCLPGCFRSRVNRIPGGSWLGSGRSKCTGVGKFDDVRHCFHNCFGDFPGSRDSVDLE